MTPTLPLPPLSLADRVGSLAGDDDPLEKYLRIGRLTRRVLLDALPDGWTWAGKRVLDFECGAGRTLRHFAAEAEVGRFHGCDIDGASIEWASGHLDPPFAFLANGEAPPLPLPDGSFDLIWSVSVWTYLTDHATDWLLEMRRLLAPDGLLVITVMGAGMSRAIAGEEWNPDRIGMTVLNYGQSWDEGGPSVLHAPWWLEEHWGRAFDIVSFTDRAFGPFDGSQGLVVLRSNGAPVTGEEIDRIDPSEPREIRSLVHERRHAWRELAEVRRSMAWLAGERTRLEESARYHEDLAARREALRAKLAAEREALSAERDRLLGELGRAESERKSLGDALSRAEDAYADRLASYEGSRSWRLTAPLRAGRSILRRPHR